VYDPAIYFPLLLTDETLTVTRVETWSPLTTLLKLINPGFKPDPYCELEDVIPLTINANGVIVTVFAILLLKVTLALKGILLTE
jgi:hypothetical protein